MSTSESAGDELLRLCAPRHRDGLWVSPAYAGLGYAAALEDVYLRPEVAGRLLLACQSLAPEGLGLLVLDGWRSLALQKALYQDYREQLADASGLSGEELAELVARFVTDPERQTAPPAHATGGAVDLTLCDAASGTPLDLGGAFDELTERSEPGYYDRATDACGRRYAGLRRLLDEAMTGAGFVRLATEWWHFEYGTRLWSERRGTAVRFGAVFRR